MRTQHWTRSKHDTFLPRSTVLPDEVRWQPTSKRRRRRLIDAFINGSLFLEGPELRFSVISLRGLFVPFPKLGVYPAVMP